MEGDEDGRTANRRGAVSMANVGVAGMVGWGKTHRLTTLRRMQISAATKDQGNCIVQKMALRRERRPIESVKRVEDG